MSQYKVALLSPSHPNQHVGVYSVTGGHITHGALSADYELPNSYILLHIGQGGDIIFEDYEGNVWARYGVLDGNLMLIRAKKILLSAVIDSVSITTSCEKMNWETPGNLYQGT